MQTIDLDMEQSILLNGSNPPGIYDEEADGTAPMSNKGGFSSEDWAPSGKYDSDVE